MDIFSGKKEKEELMLVFDIGSSTVGGALFYRGKFGVPKIVKALREPITLEKDIDAERLLFLTLKSLDIVASKISVLGVGAPRKIFCILSSPWYISQIRVINLKKNTPFIFTVKLADSLVEKEVDFLKEEYLAKSVNVGGGARLIELKNIQIMLNGYETPKPLEQKAKELKMTIFVSISGEKILEKMENHIKKHFNGPEIKFSSFAIAVFAVIRNMHAHLESFLLVDIGGEVTDISVIKKNTLRESISFPLGLNFTIRKIAGALRCSLGEAQSYFSLYKDGHASIATTKKLEPIISELRTEWLKSFQESLANISGSISVPANIYITTDKEMADFFCKVIKTEQFSQYTLTESKFKVIFLGPEIFHGLAVFKNGVIRDPSLIIGSIYANRFLMNSF